LVFGELHGYSGKLLGTEVEAKGAPTCLSMVKEEGDVNEVCHSLGQLFEEEGSKGLTG
jgi:hypothetical protein